MTSPVLPVGPQATRDTLPTDTSDQWSRLRIVAVALCFLLNMLDGADLLVMAFIAPRLAADWSVSPENLGVIFSASLAGMACGCLFVAPLADRLGRRLMIMFALGIVAVAMIASGQTTSIVQLVIARFFVGVGVGTIGVSMTAMAAEFAPPRHSSFAVGFVQAGWPLGSVITAFVAVALLDHVGWQLLLSGIGALSLLLLVIVAWALPESLSFLERRQPSNALQRLNLLRAQIGQATLDALPPRDSGTETISIRSLFAGDRARQSVILWTAVTLGYFVLYFVISWIPKLSAQAGLPVRDAIFAGASYNVGAFIGTILIGWFAIRHRLNRVAALFLALAAGAMLIFGGVTLPVSLTLLAAVAVGIFVNGGFNGFWGLAAALYPVEIRSTGIGWALGVGRIGAVLGPIVGGFLVGAGLSIAVIFAIYAIPLVLAATLCMMLRIKDAGEA